MTDIYEPIFPSLKQATSRQPLWVALISTVLGLPALAFMSVFGYTTPSCSSLGDALAWTLFLSAAVVIGFIVPYIADILGGLVACTSVALIAWLLRRLKVTWPAFAVALTSSYFLAIIVAILGNTRGSCRLF